MIAPVELVDVVYFVILSVRDELEKRREKLNEFPCAH